MHRFLNTTDRFIGVCLLAGAMLVFAVFLWIFGGAETRVVRRSFFRPSSASHRLDPGGGVCAVLFGNEDAEAERKVGGEGSAYARITTMSQVLVGMAGFHSLSDVARQFLLGSDLPSSRAPPDGLISFQVQ